MIDVYDIVLAWIFFCVLMGVEAVTLLTLLWHKKFVGAAISVLITAGIIKYFIM